MTLNGRTIEDIQADGMVTFKEIEQDSVLPEARKPAMLGLPYIIFAAINKLPEMRRTVKRLEKELQQLHQAKNNASL